MCSLQLLVGVALLEHLADRLLAQTRALKAADEVKGDAHGPLVGVFNLVERFVERALVGGSHRQPLTPPNATRSTRAYPSTGSG